jgi:hypothetical protein
VRKSWRFSEKEGRPFLIEGMETELFQAQSFGPGGRRLEFLVKFKTPKGDFILTGIPAGLLGQISSLVGQSHLLSIGKVSPLFEEDQPEIPYGTPGETEERNSSVKPAIPPGEVEVSFD